MPAPLRAKYESLDYRDFGGGYNTADADTSIGDNQLSGGQNVDINPDKSLDKRLGHTLYGNFMGTTTGVLGLVAHEPAGGTTELLSVYDTSVMRYVSGTWTALTSVTMTTNKQADSAHFPLTAKTYITNGTDAIVKYTSGTSGDQTDASFKKGKYIIHFKNRLLVANVSSQADYVWYTDLGVDTFSANNYFRVEGEVTGMEVLYDKVLIFTKRKIYILQNFSFNGTAAGPEAVIPLRTDFGAIYDRTIKKVNNVVYFLGQSSEGIAAVYATDGLNVTHEFSNPIQSDTDLSALAPAQLTSAAATAWGRFYRLAVTPTGQTQNLREYLWDTISKRWLPPYTNGLGGLSCYVTYESSGQLDVYAGSQNDGRVYKLNQANYDEEIDQSNIQVPDVNTAIDAASGAVKRASQSFQLSVTAPRTMLVTGVAMMLKKNAGTTTGLTVRIETNNAGVPSGTLAHTNLTGTIAAFTDASYVWKTVKFSTPAALSASTTYHLVVQHTTEGAGNSQYYMGMKGTASTYSGGIASAYSSSAWANIASTDASFIVFTESEIDGYADTKAFYFSPQGQEAHLRDVYVTAAATGAWNLNIGVNMGIYSGFDYQDSLALDAGGSTWGTGVFGSLTLGGTNRAEERLRFTGKRGKTFKFRFRNQYDNEPFTLYGFRTRHQILNRFK
jgi:hypothetical protein